MQQGATDHCRHLPPPFFAEYFPNGLKLLLVGSDEATLTSIQTYLPQPYYDIFVCHKADLALGHLQQEGHNSYDLVLSDVGLEDKDGYQFIREVQRLSSNIAHVAICENERLGNEILRAYRSGACSVLWKPVSELGDEIINLWRHVCRMKEQRKASETHLSNNNNVKHTRGERHETSETNLNNRDVYHGNYIQQNRSIPLVLQNQDQACSSRLAIEDEILNHGRESPPKKRRVVWSGLLQELFIYAVHQLGGPEKAVPKSILEIINTIMPMPYLTRENVGSHLQKYRQKIKETEQHASISVEPNHHNPSLAHQPVQTQIQPCEQNLNNFGPVAPLSTVHSSLMENGSNNLTSVMQQLNLTSDSSYRIPPSGTYVTTTRGNQLIGNSLGSSMLPRQHIGTSLESNILQPHQNQNSSMYQLDQYVTTRGDNNDGIQAMVTSVAHNIAMQQLERNPASGSSSCVSTNYNGIINQNQALGTSVGTNMQELSNILHRPQIAPNPTSSMQQLDQNPSSGSGIMNQNQALSTSVGANMQELSNMLQKPQIAPNPSSGSGIMNQNQVLPTSVGANTQELSTMLQKPQIAPNHIMQQLDQNPPSGSGIMNQNQALSTSFRKSNMLQQPITQNLTYATQQLDQHITLVSTSYNTPVRGDHDGNIRPEATHVIRDEGDEFSSL